MAKYLHLSKRKAFVITILFALFYVLFQCWSYYHLSDTIEFEEDIQDLKETDGPKEKQQEILSDSIFFSHNLPASYWQMIESNANMDVLSIKDNDHPSPHVHPMFQHLYLPDKDGMFACLLTGEKIGNSRINDDYCDCEDGSDEPSTAACNGNGRFYCKYQSTLDDLMWVPSSRVNDGVCDCYDGSDESESLEGSEMKKCPDLSGEMRQKEEDALEMRREGVEMKKKWIAEVPSDIKLPHELFGRKGEFYKISLSCFTIKKSKYTYDVCPFDHSTQSSYSHKISIGRNPSWSTYQPDAPKKRKKSSGSKADRSFVLLSSGGDAENCPDGKSRQTVINFVCDVQNKILSLAEDELCSYAVEFASPAAC